MPIKVNGYTQVKTHAKQLRKRREAEARQAKYDALPLAEKIAGMGAKHKARWEKQQAKKKSTPAPAPVAVATPAAEAKPKKKAYQKPKKS